MRLTEEQAQKLGIKPECNCGPVFVHTGSIPFTRPRTDKDYHTLFCPLGEWLKTRRALGEK